VKLITKIADIKQVVNQSKDNNQTIGFVPTMGALHEGHLSLVRRSLKENNLTIVSIFVNPTQFNNKEDYEKYPIQLDEDIDLLNSLGDLIVWNPTIKEMYPDHLVFPDLDLGILDEVLEGKNRPGHFKGVVQIVYRLFDVVRPNRAYFGLKDYQQVSVIKKMNETLKLGVEIIPCTTVRDSDGLALSSRNLRLTSEGKKQALLLSETLIYCKNQSNTYLPNQLKMQVRHIFSKSKLELEYIEFINPSTFELLSDEWVCGSVACIVAHVEGVRLIDNMEVFIC
jgi:pantoate--beta-alanine ligase